MKNIMHLKIGFMFFHFISMIVSDEIQTQKNEKLMIPYKPLYGLPSKCKGQSDYQTISENYQTCQMNAINKWKIEIQHYYTESLKFCCFVYGVLECETKVLSECDQDYSDRNDKETRRLFDKSCQPIIANNSCGYEAKIDSENKDLTWLWIVLGIGSLISSIAAGLGCYFYKNNKKKNNLAILPKNESKNLQKIHRKDSVSEKGLDILDKKSTTDSVSTISSKSSGSRSSGVKTKKKNIFGQKFGKNKGEKEKKLDRKKTIARGQYENIQNDELQSDQISTVQGKYRKLSEDDQIVDGLLLDDEKNKQTKLLQDIVETKPITDTTTSIDDQKNRKLSTRKSFKDKKPENLLSLVDDKKSGTKTVEDRMSEISTNVSIKDEKIETPTASNVVDGEQQFISKPVEDQTTTGILKRISSDKKTEKTSVKDGMSEIQTNVSIKDEKIETPPASNVVGGEQQFESKPVEDQTTTGILKRISSDKKTEKTSVKDQISEIPTDDSVSKEKPLNQIEIIEDEQKIELKQEKKTDGILKKISSDDKIQQTTTTTTTTNIEDKQHIESKPPPSPEEEEQAILAKQLRREKKRKEIEEMFLKRKVNIDGGGVENEGFTPIHLTDSDMETLLESDSDDEKVPVFISDDDKDKKPLQSILKNAKSEQQQDQIQTESLQSKATKQVTFDPELEEKALEDLKTYIEELSEYVHEKKYENAKKAVELKKKLNDVKRIENELDVNDLDDETKKEIKNIKLEIQEQLDTLEYRKHEVNRMSESIKRKKQSFKLMAEEKEEYFSSLKQNDDQTSPPPPPPPPPPQPKSTTKTTTIKQKDEQNISSDQKRSKREISNDDKIEQNEKLSKSKLKFIKKKTPFNKDITNEQQQQQQQSEQIIQPKLSSTTTQQQQQQSSSNITDSLTKRIQKAMKQTILSAATQLPEQQFPDFTKHF
ncbi:uncharacterized protein LOC113791593 [Dermatophagoides pteronyssinus]|uniref:uncharacterized protein LOC113791593 n=1 Tax=Dermatophagoides pteronyssinus TaxID=6956 RepID=UPI003F66CB7D